jgi:hypothetical protein
LLAVAIGVAEGWLLRQASDRLDAHLMQNQLSEARNQKRAAELRGLQISADRINSLYDRFRESTTLRTPIVARENTFGRAGAQGMSENDPVPAAVQTLAENGMIFIPGRVLSGESALIYEGGGTRLEFQKLISLLADAENGNLFLFIDRLVLGRPSTVAPFSLEPTYLETRVSLRFLAEK